MDCCHSSKRYLALPDWVQYKNSKKPSRLSVPARSGQNLILDGVKQFKTAYQRYQRENRFDKLSAEGQILPDTATEWAAIQDNETGLMWEVKTNDGGL